MCLYGEERREREREREEGGGGEERETEGNYHTFSFFYSMSAIKYISLQVNFGYARVSIYANSSQTQRGCLARKGIDREKRALAFKSQFGACPQDGIPDHYFNRNHHTGYSAFDKTCKKVLDGFKFKWRSDHEIDRDNYLTRFSVEKWSDLINADKQCHTLGNCRACSEQHLKYQQCFPLSLLTSLNQQ